MDEHLVSLNDAAKAGCLRLRKPVWANPLDHFKIDLVDGKIGPWIHLWAPFNKECNGRDPVDILVFQERVSLDTPEYVVYDGPLPTSEEYQAAVAKYDGLLK